MDINKENVALARHNAGVYGVRDYINFMEGDFFNLESQHLNAFESDAV
jgi:23S rRNA G2445 N2-methylase RlmL